MWKFRACLMTILILVFIFPQGTVRADVAPPESPPGTNLAPGSETTQVRMLAETVTLTISQDPTDALGAAAKTEAVFTMQNLGTTEEKMQVRFPLSFFNGNSDGFGNFPEIASIAVKIDGKTVSTKRETQPFFDSENSYKERPEIPWAVFDVSFPPSQDVMIEVVYSVNGFGYYPYEVFKYILETGAGWNGTIGTADIIARFPYEVNKQNVWMEEVSGYTDPTQGSVISGNEVRWHFEELEPTWENNIQFIVVAPSLWNAALKETDAVAKNPKDGEAWGRLGKDYKEIIMMPKGYLRTDLDGQEMLQLSREAYEKCLTLLPNDPLWHYGYADLLWAHYYFDVYLSGKPDSEGLLPNLISHLKTSLELDPNNQQAKELATEISYSIPEAIQINGDEYIFTALTATPIPPTPYPTETPQPATPEPVSTQQPAAAPTEVPAQPSAKNPLCGSAFLLPALFGIVLVTKKRK